MIYGIISYNIRCNYTNYGSALQSWALSQTINRMGQNKWHSVLVDYCPNTHLDSDPLNPFKKTWDKDDESTRLLQLSMPALRENYYKFEKFYNERFVRSKKMYTLETLDNVAVDEKLDGFVFGSDTIFCYDEFGIDDGYFAQPKSMRNGYSVAYAASFGDSHFPKESLETLNDRLQNFNFIGLRESTWVNYVKEHTDVPVERVIDPTLLLTSADYDMIAAERQYDKPYILMYSRRYNPKMEAYTEKLAKEMNCDIVEISLRAQNSEKGHIMRYDAGVEEFLSLVKSAEFVVTNSFHGLIFSVQYRRPFVVFSREQADTKIDELLGLFDLPTRKLVDGSEKMEDIDYSAVHARIDSARIRSLAFLEKELNGIEQVNQ